MPGLHALIKIRYIIVIQVGFNRVYLVLMSESHFISLKFRCTWAEKVPFSVHLHLNSAHAIALGTFQLPTKVQKAVIDLSKIWDKKRSNWATRCSDHELVRCSFKNWQEEKLERAVIIHEHISPNVFSKWCYGWGALLVIYEQYQSIPNKPRCCLFYIWLYGMDSIVGTVWLQP